MFEVNDKVARELYEKIVGKPLDINWRNSLSELAKKVGKPLGIPGCQLLDRMLSASRNQDWLMHLTKKRYRDHNSHQCYVALLGRYLLNCEVSLDDGKDKKTFLKYASEMVGIPEDGVEIAWLIASLLHDHAYPLASLAESMCCLKYLANDGYEDDLTMFTNFTKSYSDLFSHELCRVFLDPKSKNLKEPKSENPKPERRRQRKILCFMRKYLANTNNKFSLEELNKVKPGDLNLYDHGLWSALNLAIRFQEQTGQLFTNSLDAEYFRLAIQTIALHNIKVYHNNQDNNQEFGKIPIDSYPLGFLLLLVDELQEWDRQLLINDKLISPCSGIQIEGKPPLDESRWPEELRVKFVYNDEVMIANDWSQDVIVKSKMENLKRLTTPKTFDSIKRIIFSLSSPYSVTLRKDST